MKKLSTLAAALLAATALTGLPTANIPFPHAQRVGDFT